MIVDAILATTGTPEGLYGRRKMTHHLRRAGHNVAFCTVDRLMADLGRNGIRRGKSVRTTVPRKDGDRAADLLNRQFRAEAPNRVRVADFSHMRTWGRVLLRRLHRRRLRPEDRGLACRHRQTHRPGAHPAADRAMGPRPSRAPGVDRKTQVFDTPAKPAFKPVGLVVPGQLIHHHDAGSQGG